MVCGSANGMEPEIGIDDSPVIHEVLGKVSDVPVGTKKGFEVRGKKILVINDDNKFFAINNVCSHYGYPLENGVYANGRIRCPFHGACFNVVNGDIEDYPGFDSINTYQVKDVNGELVLSTTEKKLDNVKRTKKHKFNECNDTPVVVIGSGPAAANFVESSRQNGLPTPITIITNEEFPPYDRVVLSKNPSATGESLRLRDDAFYKDHKVTVKVKTAVTDINTTRRSLTLSTGESIPYSKLVIATGGNVRKLTVPGHNLKNVFYLRVASEANAINLATPGKHVVCIGASFIGMEIASSVAATAASVTVISSTPEPLPAFGVDVGAAIRKRFESKGVKIITAAKTVALHGTDSVEEVELEDGTRIKAEVVIAGIGVAPATEFLKSSGINIDKRGFIPVDKNFRTSADWVYAIGDVTAAPLPYWGFDNINIQHFQTAQAHGQMLGYSMVGKPHPRMAVPFFWALFFFEFGIRFAGCADGSDEVFVRGNVEELNFVKYYFKNGRVVAVANAGAKPVPITFLEIFSKKIEVTKEDVLNNESDDWDHLLLN